MGQNGERRGKVFFTNGKNSPYMTYTGNSWVDIFSQMEKNSPYKIYTGNCYVDNVSQMEKTSLIWYDLYRQLLSESFFFLFSSKIPVLWYTVTFKF